VCASRIAKRLEIDPEKMLRINQKWYDGISLYSKLIRGTVLRIPEPNQEISDDDDYPHIQATGEDLDQDLFTELSCYRHWAFKTDSLEHTHPSYMMARRVNKRTPPKPSSHKKGASGRGRRKKKQHELLASSSSSSSASPSPAPALFRRLIEPARLRPPKETKDTFDPMTFERIPRRETPPGSPMDEDYGLDIGADDEGKDVCKRREVRPIVLKLDGKELDPKKTTVAGPFDITLLRPKPLPSRFLPNGKKKRGRKPKPKMEEHDFKLIFTDCLLRGTVEVDEDSDDSDDGVNGLGGEKGTKGDQASKRRRTSMKAPVSSKSLKKAYSSSSASVDIWKADAAGRDTQSKGKPKASIIEEPPVLFDKIVTVLDAEHRYYFVLTYIPDLRWCRVCPLMEKGKFEDGHTRWVLMPEGTGRELDVTAARCRLVEAHARVQAEDADQEEWVIPQNEISTMTRGGKLTDS